MQGKVTPSVARPVAHPPTSMADHADARSARALIVALTQPDQFGYRAAVSLCTVAIGHRQHIRSTHRHNSVPLPTDVASGGGSGLLFRIVLRHITVCAFLHPCGGRPPEAARDPLKFSALFAKPGQPHIRGAFTYHGCETEIRLLVRLLEEEVV